MGARRDQPLGYSQQWNLAVERNLGGSSSASLAYAGSKGTHLIIASPYTGSGLQLNQIPDQYLSMGNALLTPVPNPFYGVLPAGSPAGGPTILKGRLLMPYPQYPLGVLQQDARIADSNYNALQASFTKRFSHAGDCSGCIYVGQAYQRYGQHQLLPGWTRRYRSGSGPVQP